MPWVWATDEALECACVALRTWPPYLSSPVACVVADYGARLVDASQPFQFDTNKALPVCHMRIGSEYVDGYIRRLDRGGGFYLCVLQWLGLMVDR